MTPWLAFGNSLHYALEETHKAGRFNFRSADELFQWDFKRAIEEEEILINYPQMRKLQTEGTEILEKYWGQIQDGTISDFPLAMEEEFSIPFAGTNIIGRIDKIEQDPEDGEYIVTDYKSGKTKPDPWQLRTNLQLTTYDWAVFFKRGKHPKKVIWHHLRTGEILESVRTEQDIENLKEMIANALKMRELDMKHRVYHDGVCNYCDYVGEDCDAN